MPDGLVIISYKITFDVTFDVTIRAKYRTFYLLTWLRPPVSEGAASVSVQLHGMDHAQSRPVPALTQVLDSLCFSFSLTSPRAVQSLPTGTPLRRPPRFLDHMGP